MPSMSRLAAITVLLLTFLFAALDAGQHPSYAQKLDAVLNRAVDQVGVVLDVGGGDHHRAGPGMGEHDPLERPEARRVEVFHDLDHGGGVEASQATVPVGERPLDELHPLPPTNTFHVGFWFDNPQDAVRCGFDPTHPTPFNGEQHAGIQALSTRTFPDNQGPLSLVHR